MNSFQGYFASPNGDRTKSIEDRRKGARSYLVRQIGDIARGLTENTDVMRAWGQLPIDNNEEDLQILAATAGAMGDLGEALTGQKILGAILGIVGVMVLVGGSPLELNAEFLLAVFASIGAAVCYGLGTVYASRHIKGLPAIQASIGQLLGASLILAIPSVATIPETAPSMRAILSLIALILMSTSFAYLLYFYLLRNVGPTRTASVTFLVPVFGTIWGIVFLSEPFNLGMLVGMAIILLSVGLVIGAKFEKKKPVVATG